MPKDVVWRFMCIVGSQAQLSGSYEVYAWFVNLLRLVIAAGFFFCGGLTPFRRFDFVPEDEESRNNFFTNAERSLVVKELLRLSSSSGTKSNLQKTVRPPQI